MYNFKQISSINKSHCKGSTSVESNIYLSFDIDWCNNEVLEDTIDLIEPYQIAATWYVTHKTSLIDKIRKNHNFELGFILILISCLMEMIEPVAMQKKLLKA